MKYPNRYVAAIVLLFAAYLVVIVGGHIARRNDSPVTVDMGTGDAAVTAVSDDDSVRGLPVSETSAFIDLTSDEPIDVIVPDRSIPDDTTTEQTLPSRPDPSGRVNINTASREELMTLTGIGEKTADAIIAYREIAPFETADEIMQVKGIGEKKYAAIKDDICV